MIAEKFSISFTFMADGGRLAVTLDAEVEKDPQKNHYAIRNLRASGSPGPSVLPELSLTKKAGHWVHIDSEKETDLSDAIGRAIDSMGPSSSPC
ncbi:MAG TPA: hypothetical protein VGR89_10955 [Puia sp.]|nr:hypothetical protein [Puia sp.]